MPHEAARASRIDSLGPRSPVNSSLNSSSSSITSSEISVTRITPKSSPGGNTENNPTSQMDGDPVKAFQDDMKLQDEGYTGTYTNYNFLNQGPHKLIKF